MRPGLLRSAIAVGIGLGTGSGQAVEPPAAPPVSAADQLNQKQLDQLRAASQLLPPDAFLGPPLMVQSMQDIGALH